jgi:hypothetical protein
VNYDRDIIHVMYDSRTFHKRELMVWYAVLPVFSRRDFVTKRAELFGPGGVRS